MREIFVVERGRFEPRTPPRTNWLGMAVCFCLNSLPESEIPSHHVFETFQKFLDKKVAKKQWLPWHGNMTPQKNQRTYYLRKDISVHPEANSKKVQI